MCLAIPSLVIAIENGMATVECFGIKRQASLLMMDDGEVNLGDYVLIQAGGFVAEKLDRETALSTQAMMAEALALDSVPP
ncbi:MAG: HypC/HybG/HupF family hydrogenase formation chaperone [Rhodospirillales bacterium]|nr:MAG: HypC/HybG/HupF family hydrogenase formation chaperone [Rhodospirillales bacterium]